MGAHTSTHPPSSHTSSHKDKVHHLESLCLGDDLDVVRLDFASNKMDCFDVMKVSAG